MDPLLAGYACAGGDAAATYFASSPFVSCHTCLALVAMQKPHLPQLHPFTGKADICGAGIIKKVFDGKGRRVVLNALQVIKAACKPTSRRRLLQAGLLAPDGHFVAALPKSSLRCRARSFFGLTGSMSERAGSASLA